jgi:hypothetical protein
MSEVIDYLLHSDERLAVFVVRCFHPKKTAKALKLRMTKK